MYVDIVISNIFNLNKDSFFLLFFCSFILHNDFLPPPRRGSHVKSDNTHTHTHTIIKIHLLPIYLTPEP